MKLWKQQISWYLILVIILIGNLPIEIYLPVSLGTSDNEIEQGIPPEFTEENQKIVVKSWVSVEDRISEVIVLKYVYILYIHCL